MPDLFETDDILTSARDVRDSKPNPAQTTESDDRNWARAIQAEIVAQFLWLAGRADLS